MPKTDGHEYQLELDFGDGHWDTELVKRLTRYSALNCSFAERAYSRRP